MSGNPGHPYGPVLDPRRAGRVTRYHTWPRVKDQSVAEHSWNVARITVAIYPDASRGLVMHCLFHDIGEVAAGDPPYPAKIMNPDLGKEHKKVEDQAHLLMAIPWGLPPPNGVSDLEKRIFKLAEFIEMMEWALDEIDLGNRSARLVLQRCQEVFEKYMRGEMGDLPEEVTNRAKSYMARRTYYHDNDWTAN